MDSKWGNIMELIAHESLDPWSSGVWFGAQNGAELIHAGSGVDGPGMFVFGNLLTGDPAAVAVEAHLTHPARGTLTGASASRRIAEQGTTFANGFALESFVVEEGDL
jgi:hypothetical protein